MLAVSLSLEYFIFFCVSFIVSNVLLLSVFDSYMLDIRAYTVQPSTYEEKRGMAANRNMFVQHDIFAWTINP